MSVTKALISLLCVLAVGCGGDVFGENFSGAGLGLFGKFALCSSGFSDGPALDQLGRFGAHAGLVHVRPGLFEVGIQRHILGRYRIGRRLPGGHIGRVNELRRRYGNAKSAGLLAQFNGYPGGPLLFIEGVRNGAGEGTFQVAVSG